MYRAFLFIFVWLLSAPSAYAERFAPTSDLGATHTCMVLQSGDVKCWGEGLYGQLGYGNTDDIGDDETPLSVGIVALGSKVIEVSLGQQHTCALLVTGDVKCWGDGFGGQLGLGNDESIGDDEQPVTGTVAIGAPVKQVAAGGGHTCTLLETGDVKCWGGSAKGALGYGNKFAVYSPQSVGTLNLSAKAIQISTGHDHSCAVLETGDVQCWGDGRFGRLGYGNEEPIGDNETPDSAGFVKLLGKAKQVSAGLFHTCALLESGKIQCWGGAAFGRLGYGNSQIIGDNETPDTAGFVDIGGEAISISAGTYHTCALLSSGDVTCWGYGGNGELGFGNKNNIGDDETPSHAGTVKLGAKAMHIFAWANHTCAILDTSDVKCWGSGSALGYADTYDQVIGDNETPDMISHVNLGSKVKN